MFSIRVATTADAERVREIYGHYIRETAITFHTDVPSQQAFEEQIDDVLHIYPWYVATDDEQGRVLGYAYASQHHPRPAYRWSVTVSIYLGPDAVGHGIGRALYEKLFGTLKRQGFRMIHAGVAMPNEASVAFHESMGLRRVATFPSAGFKLGEWHDVAWWVLDLMEGLDPNQAAPEPTPFSEL